MALCFDYKFNIFGYSKESVKFDMQILFDNERAPIITIYFIDFESARA